MHTQVATPSEHKYNCLNWRIQICLNSLVFSNFGRFVTFFIHMYKLNTVTNTNSAVL